VMKVFSRNRRDKRSLCYIIFSVPRPSGVVTTSRASTSSDRVRTGKLSSFANASFGNWPIKRRKEIGKL